MQHSTLDPRPTWVFVLAIPPEDFPRIASAVEHLGVIEPPRGDLVAALATHTDSTDRLVAGERLSRADGTTMAEWFYAISRWPEDDQPFVLPGAGLRCATESDAVAVRLALDEDIGNVEVARDPRDFPTPWRHLA
jgi:hypothetical protein